MQPDRRWLYAFLTVSLITNLFLIGVVVGGGWVRTERAPGGGPLAPAARLRAIPIAERTRFIAVMTPRRPAIRAARQAVRRARAQVEADIAQPAYDRARLEADLAVLRQATTAAQTETHAGLAEALAQLSPASRAALVSHRTTDTSDVGNSGANR